MTLTPPTSPQLLWWCRPWRGDSLVAMLNIFTFLFSVHAAYYIVIQNIILYPLVLYLS